MRHLRAVVLVCIAALMAGLLSACGDGDSASDKSPQQLVDETFKGNKDVKSANIALTFTLDAKGGDTGLGGKPVKASFTGPFELKGKTDLPDFDFKVKATAADQSFNAGAVATGDEAFLEFAGQAYKVDSATFKSFKSAFESQQRQNGKSTTGLGALGINPQDWLTDPKNEGEEDVAGAKTVHVSAQVDVPKLLDDLNTLIDKADALPAGTFGDRVPPKLTADVKKQIEDAIKNVEFDLWTGVDDKVLRKLTLRLDFEVPSSARSDAGGLEGGSLDLSLELRDLNEDQTIEKPANAKPLSELLTGALGGLVPGGRSTSGSGTPGTSSGSPGGASGDIEKYTACLKEASGAAELQKCAELLK